MLSGLTQPRPLELKKSETMIQLLIKLDQGIEALNLNLTKTCLVCATKSQTKFIKSLIC